MAALSRREFAQSIIVGGVALAFVGCGRRPPERALSPEWYVELHADGRGGVSARFHLLAGGSTCDGHGEKELEQACELHFNLSNWSIVFARTWMPCKLVDLGFWCYCQFY